MNPFILTEIDLSKVIESEYRQIGPIEENCSRASSSVQNDRRHRRLIVIMQRAMIHSNSTVHSIVDNKLEHFRVGQWANKFTGRTELIEHRAHIGRISATLPSAVLRSENRRQITQNMNETRLWTMRIIHHHHLISLSSPGYRSHTWMMSNTHNPTHKTSISCVVVIVILSMIALGRLRLLLIHRARMEEPVISDICSTIIVHEPLRSPLHSPIECCKI